MSNQLMQEMYETGKALAKIAEAMGKTPAEITALLDASDSEDENLTAQERLCLRNYRRMRSLASEYSLQYMEYLQECIAKSTFEEKKEIFREIDKVLRVGKFSSDIVFLMEGKVTECIGIQGSSGLPFQVNFTKTYEKSEETTDDAET